MFSRILLNVHIICMLCNDVHYFKIPGEFTSRKFRFLSSNFSTRPVPSSVDVFTLLNWPVLGVKIMGLLFSGTCIPLCSPLGLMQIMFLLRSIIMFFYSRVMLSLFSYDIVLASAMLSSDTSTF